MSSSRLSGELAAASKPHMYATEPNAHDGGGGASVRKKRKKKRGRRGNIAMLLHKRFGG